MGMSLAHGKGKSTAYPSGDIDMDTYFDFNQDYASPSSLRPTASNNIYADASPIDLNTMFAPEHAEDSQSFTAPSHEYGRFRQQTGLPSGAVSNVATYSNSTDGFGLANAPFAGMGGYSSGFSIDTDFEMGGQTAPAFFFPEEQASSESIDPSAINGPTSNLAANGPSRPWPGMHSQQAEQAKAVAMANKQRQQKQGQHIMQQKQQQLNTQQKAAAHDSSVRQQAPNDPVVEEKISYILGQMRHNSNASAEGDDDDSPEPGDSSRAARMRKDEEDMDDDERLLASEEGKKLTSKERRQLRNKVSARAFRSRRKEYISQLEGEVAAKSNECNALRNRNRHLMEQNEQLTHLTRKLLSHPAFHNFLDDMSNDPSILETSPSKMQELSSSDAKTEEIVQPILPSNDMDVNMASLPPSNQTLGFQMLNLDNDRWASNNHAVHFQQPQVFSVFELPQPSPLDLFSSSALSGKPSEDAVVVESKTSKKDYPIIERPIAALQQPTMVEDAPIGCSSLNADDPSLPLYADSPIATIEQASQPFELCAQLLKNLPTAKHPTHILTVTPPRHTDVTVQSINELFDSLDPILERINLLIGYQL